MARLTGREVAMWCYEGRGRRDDFDLFELPGQLVDSLFGDLGMGGRGRGRHRRRGPGRRLFGQGEVRLALLSLLEGSPSHGYELMKRLEERSGGTYRASAGTVYPVLQQLEDEGLVRGEEMEGKRIFHLTDAGREELLVHREDVDDIWRRAGGWKEWGVHMGPETAEIWGSWGRLSKSVFRTAARSNIETAEKIRSILDKARKELESL